ncbi:MAG TPA: hypothetical protein VD816_10910 [Ohtaekwangia sp.]|nr:hypothetical protein [Ohtaekwangia sp.]
MQSLAGCQYEHVHTLSARVGRNSFQKVVVQMNNFQQTEISEVIGNNVDPVIRRVPYFQQVRRNKARGSVSNLLLITTRGE